MEFPNCLSEGSGAVEELADASAALDNPDGLEYLGFGYSLDCLDYGHTGEVEEQQVVVNSVPALDSMTLIAHVDDG